MNNQSGFHSPANAKITSHRFSKPEPKINVSYIFIKREPKINESVFLINTV